MTGKLFVSIIVGLLVSDAILAMPEQGLPCGLAGFIRRYIVLVVGLPAIAVLHLAWYKLQFKDTFVPKEDRKLNFFGVDLDKKNKDSSEENSEE